MGTIPIAKSLNALSEPEQRLFFQYGQGPQVQPEHSLIHESFEHFAAIQPKAVAAMHKDALVTYEELDQQANRLAAHLLKIGVCRGDNVGLYVERSIPMIVGILATLKIGAAYVPQDARIAPESQLRFVTEAASVKVILTLSHLRALVPHFSDRTYVHLDTFMMPGGSQTVTSPTRSGEPSDCCFVLFTSGTTGRPNGVKVTHTNVCNILLTHPGSLGMRPGQKVSQILNIAFDMAAWEILGCLANGATLVIRGKDIAETVQKVDVVIATPSILGTVDPALCRQVKTVAVAGEPCPRPLADAWATFADFYNSCGPTEVTIVNTMQRHLPTFERLTIGKPTPNNTVYILNEDMMPCHIGEIGEMWAGGVCVSAGYINNDELNFERYKHDPFLGKGMMFRTRDLARWTESGELEHFGRTDDQVKIRGFRVELDSVSNTLESVANCVQAVTLKLDSRNLVAFVRPSSVDIEQARAAIEESLPYYCSPSLILAMDEFPQTDRGKIDKRLLTSLAVQKLERQYGSASKGVFV